MEHGVIQSTPPPFYLYLSSKHSQKLHPIYTTLLMMPRYNWVRNRLWANVMLVTQSFVVVVVVVAVASLSHSKHLLLSLRFRTDKLPQDVALLD